MSFSNLPSQLVAIFLGWVFTLFLQHRANVRAESIRKKDKIIERIDKLVEWAEKNTSCTIESRSDVEEIYSAMVSQVEIRIGNLDRLLKSHSVPRGSLAELRSVDVLDTDRTGDSIKALRMAAVSLIEDLELACDARYFSRDTVLSRLNRAVHEMMGIAAGALALLFLFLLFRAIQGVLS